MTFKITIERAPIGVEFEVGSIAEAIAILEQEDTNLRRVVSIGDSLSGNGEQETATGVEGGATAEPAKRGRKPKDKNQPDPATAQAPAPLPIPPVDMTSTDGGIPAGLRRDPTTNTAPAMVAPPPPPPAPPAPPAAPPSGILAGKVIANLDQRKAGTADDGKSLVEWLASPSVGLVNSGSTYDESIAAIRLMGDEKLAAVATALAVA